MQRSIGDSNSVAIVISSLLQMGDNGLYSQTCA